MTHVSIFQGLFKKIVFRSVALVKKKLWAILDFFYTDRTFYRPVPYPICMKKMFFQKSFLFSDSVKNESNKTKKKGMGRQTPPPHPACLGLSDDIFRTLN